MSALTPMASQQRSERSSRQVARTRPSGGPPVERSLSTPVLNDPVALNLTDVSDLLEARSDRDRAKRDSRQKDEFIATLAHELRNPLAAIRSAVQVLEHVPKDSESTVQARDVIARQVGHLSRLIEDLLDVERIATNRIQLRRRPLDLGVAVQRAIASFTGNAALDRHIEIDTESMWIDGDADRLEQVFSNLLMNAVKFTPPDGLIRVSLHVSGADAVFTVADMGCGITPELLPRIFDMFVQGDGAIDGSHGGLGIGLALVRRLVELHDGTVTASSAGAGRGSTFTVRLPRVPQPDRDASAAPPAMVCATPRKVLLIEDGPDTRMMFRMMLQLAGHTVFEAADGVRGLQLLQIERPDVAIVDIGLPGMDGYEVARRIRAHASGRDILLLALTGYDSPSDYELSAEAGFDHHLVKPIDPAELARLVCQPGPWHP